MGDLEYAFFSNTTSPDRHSGTLAALLLDPSADAPLPVIVVVRNPSIVLDTEFPDRIAAAVALLDAMGEHWSAASPHGLARSGEVVSSIYSSVSPSLPSVRSTQPLVDTAPDMLVINGAFLVELRGEGVTFADACLEQAILIQGYLAGRVAVFLPSLAIALHGSLLPWTGPAAIEGLQRAFGKVLGDQAVPTLFGTVRLGAPGLAALGEPPARAFSDCVNDAVRTHCTPLSLSIVTRTRFNRPHLLHRMLTSIARSGADRTNVEVVLSTDISAREAQEQFRAIKKLFPKIDMRLRVNAPHEHSRIGNLLGGVAAARRDLVAFVDDDDYVDLTAFSELALVTFMGTLPLVFMANALHEEEWSQTPSGRHVLARSTMRQHYPPGGWRQMFEGVNQLPISAVVVPRQTLIRRLELFDFRHDLSEDYILILLLLTDPALPPIAELATTFVNISSRPGQDNTITMVDRRPWARDIALFLSDLVGNTAVAGPGVWQLLRGLADQGRTSRDDATIRNLNEVVGKQRRDLSLLLQEVRRLTGILGAQD